MNYVKCQGCAHIVNQEGFDPHEFLCQACKNIREVQDPKEILCNLCGECMCPLGSMNEQIPHGLYKAKVEGGYDSYHLFDYSSYIFNLCEKCLRQMFIQCKIKPKIVDDMADAKWGWEEDQRSYEYRIWKDTGGHHQAYLDRRCNALKDCPNAAVYSVRDYDDAFMEECSCEEHKDICGWAGTQLIPFVPNTLKAFI